MTTPAPCPICDDVVVRRERSFGEGSEIDIDSTMHTLIARTERGEMKVLRGDVPLQEMVALLESDTKYMIVAFLACQRCLATKFWGLCTRGEPIYRTCETGAEESWLWGPVPPREIWRR